jgi:hypothetical protein
MKSAEFNLYVYVEGGKRGKREDMEERKERKEKEGKEGEEGKGRKGRKEWERGRRKWEVKKKNLCISRIYSSVGLLWISHYYSTLYDRLLFFTPVDTSMLEWDGGGRGGKSGKEREAAGRRGEGEGRRGKEKEGDGRKGRRRKAGWRVGRIEGGRQGGRRRGLTEN